MDIGYSQGLIIAACVFYMEYTLIWLMLYSQVAISTVGLLLFGKWLEPLWGSKEFLKFIIVVNLLTSICVFVTAIALYYITRQESYL